MLYNINICFVIRNLCKLKLYYNFAFLVENLITLKCFNYKWYFGHDYDCLHIHR